MFCTLLLALLIAPSFSSAANVKWEGLTVQKGQTGKITAVKATSMLVERSTGSFTKPIKKGEVHRVFGTTKKSGANYYNLGSGKFVKVSANVKFKAIPASAVQALGVKYTIKDYKLHDWIRHEAKVAQVSGLINKKHEDSINKQLRSGRTFVLDGIKGVEESLYYDFNNDYAAYYEHFSTYLGTMSSDKVLYNSNNYFAVESTIYCGWCTSTGYAWQYATYNLLTGKKVQLKEYVKTTAQKKKLRSTLIAEAKKRGVSANDFEMLYNYFGVNDYNHLPYESTFYVKDDKLYFMFYIYSNKENPSRIFLPVSISALKNAK